MAACPLCGSRKGKRSCPAKRALICSICCGEKRIVEIACPRDCAYLERGTLNDVRREAADYLSHQSPDRAMHWLRTMEALEFLVEAIERIIASAPVRSLEDSDLLGALRSARSTFDAEAKGVIYEDLPPSPTMQALARYIVAGVRSLDEERRDRGDGAAGWEGERSWGAAEAASCLLLLAERCEYHIGKGAGAGSFIAHLRRIHGGSEGERPGDAPRIVLV